MLFIFNLDNKTKTFTCLQNYLYFEDYFVDFREILIDMVYYT